MRQPRGASGSRSKTPLGIRSLAMRALGGDPSHAHARGISEKGVVMVNANPRALIIVSLVSGLVGGVLATFLLIGSSVIAQPTAADIPPVITAQEFRLVDTKGHIRATLAFSDDGEPYLHLRDAFGTHRVWIGISDETASRCATFMVKISSSCG